MHPPLIEAVTIALKDIFENGYYADKVLERVFKKNRKFGSRDRRLIAHCTYDIVRWWRRMLWTLKRHEEWSTPSHEERLWPDLIALWAQLNEISLPDDLALGRDYRGRWQHTKMPVAARVSVSDTWATLWESEIGPDWPDKMSLMNQMAPVFLRVNLSKTSLKVCQEQLEKEEILTTSLTDCALKVKGRKNVFRSQAFQSGWFEVQDLGSQEIARFAAPAPGERVVDACAGAGGKTLHLADLMNDKGKIIAMDIHEWKLKELKKRAKRSKFSLIEPRPITSSKTIKRLREQADLLLLDVPCSGSGVLKRNPDAKWKFSEDQFQRLLAEQKQILASYSKMVKPGGRMIYATCSLFPSENDKQIEGFLNESEGWVLADQKFLAPEPGGGDGFYMARLERKPS